MSLPKTTPRVEVWMQIKDRKLLAKLMLIQGVSQRQLARAVGWESHSYLGRLLAGKVNTLDTEPALLMTNYLGVGVDDLFLTKVSRKPGQPVKEKAA